MHFSFEYQEDVLKLYANQKVNYILFRQRQIVQTFWFALKINYLF